MATHNAELPKDLSEFLETASRVLDFVDEVHEYVTTYAFGHRTGIELNAHHFEIGNVKRFVESVERHGREWRSDDEFAGLDHEILDEIVAARKRFNRPFRPDMEFHSRFAALWRRYRSATEFLLILFNETSRAFHELHLFKSIDYFRTIATKHIDDLDDEERSDVMCEIGIVIGRLSFMPWINSGYTLLEIGREIDAVARARNRGLSWYVRVNRANDESLEEQLTPNAEAVFNYLRQHQPKMGKEIAAATDIPLSTITRHVIPQLKEVCGLRNVPGKGYLLPRNA